MADKPGAGKSGCDKYVNYKTFSIAVGAFVALLVMPKPESMLVGILRPEDLFREVAPPTVGQ